MSDIDQLREQFPTWHIGAVSTTAASGPDRRRLWAFKDGAILSAWTAEQLARDIRLEEQ